MMDTPPMPLEWHPAYRDKTWLLDWLESSESEAHLAIDRPQRLEGIDEVPATVARTPSTLILTKCMWRCAVDDLGRAIAGEARPQYLPDWAE